MGNYKYPYIPKEYYPAVMYACSCIRKYGTFNVAVRSAASKYGLDEDEIAKHVRKRQGAGQKGISRKYKWYVVSGWTDEWWQMHDYDILWSQEDPEDWKENREYVVNIIKATSVSNMKKQIPSGELDRDYRLTGKCVTNIEYKEFATEAEAKEYIKNTFIPL